MSKFEQVIQRKNGTQIKIVAEEFYGSGLTRSVGVYVLRRESLDHDWQMTSDRPHPDWRKMSVAEYVKNGRSEMLQLVSSGEILKVINSLNTNL